MESDDPNYQHQKEGREGLIPPTDEVPLNSRAARFFSWLGRHFFAVTLVLTGLLLLFALL